MLCGKPTRLTPVELEYFPAMQAVHTEAPVNRYQTEVRANPNVFHLFPNKSPHSNTHQHISTNIHISTLAFPYTSTITYFKHVDRNRKSTRRLHHPAALIVRRSALMQQSCTWVAGTNCSVPNTLPTPGRIGSRSPTVTRWTDNQPPWIRRQSRPRMPVTRICQL